MEAKGIEPLSSPCKGDVLPIDYASAPRFFQNPYLSCLAQNLYIAFIAVSSVFVSAKDTILI